MVSYSDKYVLMAAVASFIFGYQLAVLNTALVFFTIRFSPEGKHDFYVSEEAKKWDATVLMMVFLGATIGSFASGFIVSKGRRFGLMVCHVVSIIGASVCFFAHDYLVFTIGRFICGLSVGLITVAVPTVISEMCPAKIRGSRGTMHQLGITVGILVAVALGLVFTQPPVVPSPDYAMDSFQIYWSRFMVGLPGLLSSAVLTLMLFVYTDETPQALFIRGRTAEAVKVLALIYKDPAEAEARLEELAEAAYEQTGKKTSSGFFRKLKSTPGCLTAVVVGCVLSAGQQLGGINAFVARSKPIFEESGMSPSTAALCSMLMSLVNVLMTFPAIFVIDTLGRKPLLLLGVFGQAVMLSIVPIIAILGYSIAIASAVSVIGFIVFFALAYGPVLWVYLFEIYPPEIKGTACGIASGLNWSTGTLIVFLNSLLGPQYNIYNFAFFATACWLILVFIFVMVKETKGSTYSPFITGENSEQTPLKP